MKTLLPLLGAFGQGHRGLSHQPSPSWERGRFTGSRRDRFRGLLTLFLLAAALGAARAQETVTQILTLHPGWNAIWLEVRPAVTEVSAVFAGVPIESVWTFQERLSAVDFIQDPNEPVWNKDRWLVHVPTNRLESFQNNLYHLQANRAYLVKLEGNSDVPLAITGRPSLRVPEWVPNAYNLRGFPVDPAGPAPTFLDFFWASPAHFDAASGTLRKVYRLSNAGQWRLVAPGDTLRAGEACWVYTQGASDYQGPLSVRLDFGDALDYGYVADRLSLIVQNLASSPATITLTDLGAPAPNPLSYYLLDPTNGVQWIPLPSPHSLGLAAAEKRTLRLAARRPDMAGESFATVIEVGNGAGLRCQVPVSIRKVTATSLSPKPGSDSPKMGPPGGQSSPHAGLWIGTATINAVSEAHGGVLVTNFYAYLNGQPVPLNHYGVHAGTNYVVATNVWVEFTADGLTLRTNLGKLVTNQVVWARSTADGTALPVHSRVERIGAGTTPTPTKNEFNLRLIIHVDAGGQARLLKEVIQMWKEGAYTNAPDGWKVMERSGSYVLVTDETLLAQFRGAAVRDGRDVGRRISTVDFDFPSAPANNFLLLSNRFEMGATLTGTIILPANFPTNPFRHKYHPDHGNSGSYSLTRALELTLSSTNSTGRAQTSYGYDVMSGTYRETVSGLHKADVVASGTFTLNRVDITPYLNQ